MQLVRVHEDLLVDTPIIISKKWKTSCQPGAVPEFKYKHYS